MGAVNIGKLNLASVIMPATPKIEEGFAKLAEQMALTAKQLKPPMTFRGGEVPPPPEVLAQEVLNAMTDLALERWFERF